MEGETLGYLGASPLRTMLEVLLQSGDVEKMRLAHVVADLGETFREVDVHVLESGEEKRKTTRLRVVLSKIQILGLVVLSDQVDHNIRVPNAVANRILVQRMERNRIHFANISRLLQMTNLITFTTVRNHASHSARSCGSNPTNKQIPNSYTTLPPKLLLETAKKVDFKEN